MLPSNRWLSEMLDTASKIPSKTSLEAENKRQTGSQSSSTTTLAPSEILISASISWKTAPVLVFQDV